MRMREYGWLACGGAFFFLMSWILFYQVPPTKNHQDIDSGAYVQAASFLLEDGSFERLVTTPYYGLGYPLFLAGLKKIGSNSVGFIVAIQVLLAWLVALLAWKIADNFFGRRAAWIAYVLALTNVGLLVFAQFLLTEIVLVLLLTLFVERMISFLGNKKLSTLVLAGFFLGLSCIVKAVAVMFVVPLVFFVSVAFWKNCSVIKNIFGLLIAFALPYGLYQVHNKVMLAPHGHSMFTVNLYGWYYPHLRAQINGTTSDEEKIFVRQQVASQELPAMLVHDVLAYPGKACIALGKNWIKTLLGLYTSNVKLLIDTQFVSGGLSFFNLKGTLWQRLWGYIAGKTAHVWIGVLGVVEAFFLLMRYILVPCGLWVLCTRRRWVELVFVVLYLGYFIGITGHDGCARFRLMIDVLVVVLAGGGLAVLSKSWLPNVGLLKGTRKKG